MGIVLWHGMALAAGSFSEKGRKEEGRQLQFNLFLRKTLSS